MHMRKVLGKGKKMKVALILNHIFDAITPFNGTLKIVANAKESTSATMEAQLNISRWNNVRNRNFFLQLFYNSVPWAEIK
jgi:hypothetical protein